MARFCGALYSRLYHRGARGWRLLTRDHAKGPLLDRAIGQGPGLIVDTGTRTLVPGEKLLLVSDGVYKIAPPQSVLPREPFPPAFERLLRQRRLKEWLSVLGFDVIRERRFFYALPFFVARWTGHTDRMEKLGGRWCSRLSCAYVLHAQKRVFRIVPVGRILRRRAPAVVGLAEPSTRNVA